MSRYKSLNTWSHNHGQKIGYNNIGLLTALWFFTVTKIIISLITSANLRLLPFYGFDLRFSPNNDLVLYSKLCLITRAQILYQSFVASYSKNYLFLIFPDHLSLQVQPCILLIFHIYIAEICFLKFPTYTSSSFYYYYCYCYCHYNSEVQIES